MSLLVEEAHLYGVRESPSELMKVTRKEGGIDSARPLGEARVASRGLLPRFEGSVDLLPPVQNHLQWHTFRMAAQ